MTTSRKKSAAKGAKRPGTRRPTTNGLMNGAARKKTKRPKISNAKLLKLADKYPPPQSWYDEEQNLF